VFDFSEVVRFAACFLKITMEINTAVLEYNVQILEEATCAAIANRCRSRR